MSDEAGAQGDPLWRGRELSRMRQTFDEHENETPAAKIRRVEREEMCCSICEGHGTVWVNWHPTPVTCGHCDGTGVRQVKEDE